MRSLERTDAERTLDAQRSERTRTWTDEGSGLQVQLCCGDVCGVDPVVEWTVWLKNYGQGKTLRQHREHPRTRLYVSTRGHRRVRAARRPWRLRVWRMSFRPYALTLGPDAREAMFPTGRGRQGVGKIVGRAETAGRTWNLHTSPAVASISRQVGWPGQWEAHPVCARSRARFTHQGRVSSNSRIWC